MFLHKWPLMIKIFADCPNYCEPNSRVPKCIIIYNHKCTQEIRKSQEQCEGAFFAKRDQADFAVIIS